MRCAPDRRICCNLTLDPRLADRHDGHDFQPALRRWRVPAHSTPEDVPMVPTVEWKDGAVRLLDQSRLPMHVE
ncbi:MAG TPA: hypothetical protein PLF68_14840, partial [Nitrospira sp.]|nr:hypothetical protein [Nitrospira sp.]